MQSEPALALNQRLQQLEKDNEYLRRAVQKTQSELNEIKDQSKQDRDYIDIIVKKINQFYLDFLKPTPAIPAAKPKHRSRTKPTAKRVKRAR